MIAHADALLGAGFLLRFVSVVQSVEDETVFCLHLG